MILFLNGGGCGEQATQAYEVFKSVIDTTKPFLVVSLFF